MNRKQLETASLVAQQHIFNNAINATNTIMVGYKQVQFPVSSKSAHANKLFAACG
jgi:hypothetical protein